jgi:peptidyl-prolyl cis-trans isomerase A (cyclophilin A)
MSDTMSKKKWQVIVITLIGLVAVGVIYHLQPERLTPELLEEIVAAQQHLRQTEGETTRSEPAPDRFRAKFECSKGTFVIECYKDWAPLGAQRFYDLVKQGFYSGTSFHRVMPGYIVQFGISGDPQVSQQWRHAQIKDDPPKESNLVGTVSFARSGENSRNTQVFVNLADNAIVTSLGFRPFGKVISGMEVIKSINAEYGEQPNQFKIERLGKSYLAENFPNLDYITSAVITE